MKIHLHQHDLPQDVDLGSIVAIDTETMGLVHNRDRLCLVQLSSGNGVCHLVQIINAAENPAPILTKLLTDKNITKLFHFARFDVAVLYRTFGTLTTNIYCTKIASKLVRTYTDRHGLKELCKELLGVEISKTEQTSDWGAAKLTDDQLKYAAADVLYLHRLKTILDQRLAREGRTKLAQACFEFLPHRAKLDLLTQEDYDIFSH